MSSGEHALARNIIIPTQVRFGTDQAGPLLDRRALTPDSSRSAVDSYKPELVRDFRQQFVRDYLES